MTREVPALKGAFTPLVAPFRNGGVDYDLYAKIIEWRIEQGAQGLPTPTDFQVEIARRKGTRDAIY
jgi:hypothetical protein